MDTYSDYGDDMDNVPNNTKELKHLDGWDCKLAFTALGVTAKTIKLSLGAADIDSVDTGKVTPRRKLKMSDFEDSLWWVGDRSDGGFVAVELKNALSTGGFSLQTTKNGKGQLSCEISGHVSINAQYVVPMVFYSEDPATAHHVRQILMNVTSSFNDVSVEDEDALSVELTAVDGYDIANVIVTMGGTDVTSSAYDSSTDTVSIASVTGDVEIFATANET